MLILKVELGSLLSKTTGPEQEINQQTAIHQAACQPGVKMQP
jgi:hypothetical protein|tara:strand:+ start:137494 stop:137619 length:126 start_codon:yes stop_codon:yes gene_type:complete